MTNQSDAPNPKDAPLTLSGSAGVMSDIFLTEVDGIRKQDGQSSDAYKQQIASIDQTLQSNHLTSQVALGWAESQFNGKSESKQDLESLDKKTSDPFDKLMVESLIGNYSAIKAAHSDPTGGIPILHWFSHEKDAITKGDLDTVRAQTMIGGLLLTSADGKEQDSLYEAIRAATGVKQDGVITQNDVQQFIQKCKDYQSHPNSSNSSDTQYLTSSNEEMANILLQGFQTGMLKADGLGDGISISKLANTLWHYHR